MGPISTPAPFLALHNFVFITFSYSFAILLHAMKHRYFKFHAVPVSDTYWIPIRARYVSNTAMKYPAYLKNKKNIGCTSDTGGIQGDTRGYCQILFWSKMIRAQIFLKSPHPNPSKIRKRERKMSIFVCHFFYFFALEWLKALSRLFSHSIKL